MSDLDKPITRKDVIVYSCVTIIMGLIVLIVMWAVGAP